MRSLTLLLALLPGIALAAALRGKDIVLHGNSHGAMPCAACHGVNGQGNSAIGAPPLAGLPAGVIEADLANFAKGNSGGGTMQFIAQALSPDEVKAVAEYFAALPKP